MRPTSHASTMVTRVPFGAWRFVRSGQMVPRGFYNFFEFLIEFLWKPPESAAGRWAKRLFPIMATIFLLVFWANAIRGIPGFESIGYLEPAAVVLLGRLFLDEHPGPATFAGRALIVLDGWLTVTEEKATARVPG